MTPQRPAAPETETDANGLTEAERASLRRDILNRYYMRGIATNETGLTATVEAACDVFDAYLAERVRVVEGERGRAQMEALGWKRGAERNAARAESAEAAHKAEKAAHERLRAGVEALAEDLRQRRDRLLEEFEGPRSESRAKAYGAVVSQITALLGGGGAR